MTLQNAPVGQRGVAVVLAMGVVAFAAMAATALMVTQSTWSRQNELTTSYTQAQTMIGAGIDWARAVLNDDRRLGSVDHLGETWALRLPPMPVDNGELAGYIEDRQGAFNLNNLVKDGKIVPAQLDIFRRLLSILNLPDDLADALADWIDSDGEPQLASGAEDAYYLGLQPPYRTANHPLVDVAELSLVRGFDDGVRVRLRPFVTALPRATAVNVNTAAAELLVAVIDGLDIDQARTLVAHRDRTYFRGVADFMSQLPRELKVPAESITVSSIYFMATLRVTIGPAEARGLALLAREGAGWPVVVWRKTS